jgi:hypothetical protein
MHAVQTNLYSDSKFQIRLGGKMTNPSANLYSGAMLLHHIILQVHTAHAACSCCRFSVSTELM